MESYKLGIIVFLLFQVSQAENENPYIVRTINGKVRYCIRIYDCPPGHQILPCDEDYTKDHCLSCQNGMVQPLLVSSSENMESTKCFENKNKDKCMANDVRPSRNEYSEKMCNYHDYCECDTYQCNYGDPCMCNRGVTCGINETMNEKGECIKCPVGMEKTQEGCGPCTQVINKKSTHTLFPPTTISPTIDPAIHNGGATPVISKSFPKEPRKMPTKDKTKSTKGSHNESSKTPQTKQDTSPSSSALVAIIVVLAVLAVAVVVLLIYFLRDCKTKKTEIKENGQGYVEATQLLPEEPNRLDVNEDNENLQRIVVDKPELEFNIATPNSSGQCSGVVNSQDLSANNMVIDDIKYDPNLLPNVITALINETETDDPHKPGESKKGDNNDNDKTKVIEVTLENFLDIRKRNDRKIDDSSADSNYFGDNEDRNSGCSTGYKQLTKNCRPVTQVSDDGPLDSKREVEPSSPTYTNQDESIGSCLEYHNYTVKGHDLTSSTNAKTFSSSLPFSTCQHTNSDDLTTLDTESDNYRIPTTTHDKKSDNFGIPTTIAELSSMENSLNTDTSNPTCLLDDVNNNKDTRDDSKNKIERQNDKSVEIRLQASSLVHAKDTIPVDDPNSPHDSRSSTFDDSGIRVDNNSNGHWINSTIKDIGLMPKRVQSREILFIDNRQS